MSLTLAAVLGILSAAGSAASSGSQVLAKQKAKQTESGNQLNANMANNVNNFNMSKPIYQFNAGGLVPGAVPITVEGQEVIKTPAGKASKVVGPEHEQGGVDMVVPQGTQVYSKDLINPDTGNSFSADAEGLQKQLNKYKNKKGGTRIDDDTKARMLSNLQAQLDGLFQKQQSLNGNNQGTYGNAGMLATKNPTGYQYPLDVLKAQNMASRVNPINIPLAPKLEGLQMPTTSVPTTGFAQTSGTGVLPWVNAAATLGGTIWNLAQGTGGDETTPNYNPYEGGALQAMKNRSYNISPILSANRAAQAVSNRNINNVAGSAGAMMGNYIAAQNSRSLADANAWATKQNADNAYLGEYAQLLNNAGQNRAAMDWQVQLANEQNQAARMQHFGQGFTDIGEFAQMQQLMRNEAGADTQRMGIYQDLYKTIIPFMTNSGSMAPNYADLLSKLQTGLTK